MNKRTIEGILRHCDIVRIDKLINGSFVSVFSTTDYSQYTLKVVSNKYRFWIKYRNEPINWSSSA